jgi:hypothetical protein
VTDRVTRGTDRVTDRATRGTNRARDAGTDRVTDGSSDGSRDAGDGSSDAGRDGSRHQKTGSGGQEGFHVWTLNVVLLQGFHLSDLFPEFLEERVSEDPSIFEVATFPENRGAEIHIHIGLEQGLVEDEGAFPVSKASSRG